MGYRREFPDYDGEFKIPNGFRDNSWHNDTCPHVMKRFENGDNVVEFDIWQDYEDPDLRENEERYIFQVFVNEQLIMQFVSDYWDDMETLANGTTDEMYGWKNFFTKER